MVPSALSLNIILEPRYSKYKGVMDRYQDKSYIIAVGMGMQTYILLGVNQEMVDI